MTCYRHQSKWRYDFWKNGIRQRESGFPTKAAAKAAEAEARKRLKKTNSDFINLCASRLKELKERRTEKYFTENKSLFEKLIVKWVKNVTRKDVEDFLSESALKSNNLANKRLKLIKALFNHGIERRMISENPAFGIKLFPTRKSKKYIPPKEDVLKVFSVVTHEQKLYLLALINTMARISEINKLKWDDVAADYIVLRTKKSKNSDITERKVPINSTLNQVLKSLPRIGEYVFCHTDKTPYKYRSKFLKNACNRAKVKFFTYHALRHYGASTLASQGVSIPDIQALLGHQRSSTTDLYLQSISPNLRSAMDKLEDSPI